VHKKIADNFGTIYKNTINGKKLKKSRKMNHSLQMN